MVRFSRGAKKSDNKKMKRFFLLFSFFPFFCQTSPSCRVLPCSLARKTFLYPKRARTKKLRMSSHKQQNRKKRGWGDGGRLSALCLCLLFLSLDLFSLSLSLPLCLSFFLSVPFSFPLFYLSELKNRIAITLPAISTGIAEIA